MVRLLADGPEYGEAKDKPMPEPKAIMIKATAVAASAPAIAALQEKEVRATSAGTAVTSRSMIVVSAMTHSFARAVSRDL
jgi:hypothetical protein